MKRFFGKPMKPVPTADGSSDRSRAEAVPRAGAAGAIREADPPHPMEAFVQAVRDFAAEYRKTAPAMLRDECDALVAAADRLLRKG